MNTTKTFDPKMRLLPTFVFLCTSILGWNCYGASVPWVGVLSAASPITVPAGKILIIEHMCFNNTTANGGAQPVSMTLAGTNTSGIGSGNYSVTIQYTVSSIGGYTPANSTLGGTLTQSVLRLNGGSSLRLITGSTFVISVTGVALDASDFYAKAEPAIRSLSNDGSQLSMIVDSHTTRNTVTSGEASTDLKSWTNAGVTVAHSSSNPRISKITTAANSAKKFLRAKLYPTLASATD